MRKIIIAGAVALSAITLVNCNNNSEPENVKTDTAVLQSDTVTTKIVTEGGLRDSLQTGASDSAKKIKQ